MGGAAADGAINTATGVGDVGVDIFFREAQRSWPELYTFADDRARRATDHLGLPADPRRLARLTDGPSQFVRLVSALVQAELDRSIDDIARAS